VTVALYMDEAQLCVTIGVCVRDLELIAKAADPEDLANHVLFLPL